MIVITGNSGLVGANLARALLARGQPVRGIIHRDRRAVADLGLELVEADVRDLDSLARALEGADLIYHLAARLTGTRPPRFTAPLGLAELAAPLMSGLARLTGASPIFTQATLDALRSNRLVSRARAEQDLGYKPRRFEETLADTLEWFHQNGYLKHPIHRGSSLDE